MRPTAAAALWAFFLAAPCALAQAPPGSVGGVVLDPASTGIPGVTVTLDREGAQAARAVTGYGGQFQVSGVAPGPYRITARLDGFEPAAMAIVVKEGTATQVSLAFARPVLHQMVEVTGRRDVVTPTEIRESAAVDVGQALAQEPGLAMIRKGAIANDVVLRGLQRDNINVLVDGEKIYGACPNRMDSPAFHVDFSEIEQIEVTKGPYDLENQGSLGGMVNIVTRRPEPGLHASATVVAGTAGTVNPSVHASWGQGKVFASAGYSYRGADPYRDGAARLFTEVANYQPGRFDTRAYGVQTAWGKLIVEPAAGQSVELAYTRQAADRVLYPRLLMDATWDDADRLGVGWRLETGDGLVRDVRVKAYGTRVRHYMTDELRVTGAGTPLGFSMGTMAEASTLGVKADATIGAFRAGVEALRRGWNTTTQMAKMGYAAQSAIPDVATTVLGGFVSTHRELSRTLALDLGARVDTARSAADPALASTALYFAYNGTRSTSRSDTLPSASARLTFRPSGALELAAGVGRTVRLPDPEERDYALKRAATDWVGNPEVVPTRNTGADLTARVSLPRGSVTGSLFASSIADFIAVHDQPRLNAQPGVTNTTARSYANVDARTWGAEASLSYALADGLFVGGNVSFTRGSKETDPSRNLTSANLAEVPPLAGRLSARWDTGSLYAEAEGVFAAAQDRVDTDLQEEATPGWGILNLKVGGTVADFRIQAVVGNAFGRLYTEHLSCTRDPYHAGVRVYEPGRSLMVTVSRKL